MAQQIENIIFDFGGVLVDIDKQRCIDQFARVGFNATPFVGNYTKDGFFAQYEMGNISTDAFCDEIAKHSTNPDITADQIVYAWKLMLVGIPPERLDMLLRLRERYIVYLLSNIGEMHWDMACEQMFNYHGFNVDNFFEQIFLSYEMHLMKPDPLIFETLLKQTVIKQSATLFIDDSEENCKVASSFGLKTFQSREPGDWMKLFL
jgi:FMN phosphatase YigB (HAD superfamily)